MKKKNHSNGEKNKNIKDLISNTIKGSLFAVVAVRKNQSYSNRKKPYTCNSVKSKKQIRSKMV